MACQIEVAIEKLKELAQGDGRTKAVKEAKKELEKLGIKVEKKDKPELQENEVLVQSTETLGAEEDYRMGDNYPGSDATYSKLTRKAKEDYVKYKKLIGKELKLVKEPGEVNADYQTLKEVKREGLKVRLSFNKGSDVYLKNEEDSVVEKGTLYPSIMDSVDNMIEHANVLEDISNVKTTKEQKSYFKDTLIPMIDTKFLGKVKYYMKESANKNAGTYDMGVISLNVNTGEKVVNNEMGLQEVHWHEIFHSLTRYAIDSGTTESHKISRQIQAIRDKASKYIKVEDLMSDTYLDEKQEKELAQKMYDYIFEDGNSTHEFLAYAMTNEKIRKILEQNYVEEKKESVTLFQKLSDLFHRLLRVLSGEISLGNVGKNHHQAIMELTANLMQLNNKEEVKIQNNTGAIHYLAEAIKTGNKGVGSVIEYFKEMAAKGDITPPPKNASRLEMAKWTAKWWSQLMLREDLHHYREYVMNSLWMAPEGLMANIGRDMTQPDSLERMIEMLGMASDTIDQTRQAQSKYTEASIKAEFKTELSELDEEALTMVVIDTDMASIWSKYDSLDLADMLINDKKLESAIKKIEDELQKADKENYFWNLNQSRGLGYYLVTHKAHSAQNLNATNIAKGILSDSQREANPEVVELIDELSTLVAMKYTPKAAKAIASDIIARESKGLQNIVDLVNGVKKESRAKIFNSETNMIKGYSNELFESHIDIQIKPKSAKEVMAMDGYEMIPIDGSNMAIYRDTNFVSSTQNRQATRLTNKKAKGTSIDAIEYALSEEQDKSKSIGWINAQREIKRLDKERRRITQDLAKGEVKLQELSDLSAIPILNDEGQVVNYRYTMSKWNKKQLLEQDTKVGAVLGHTLASVGDKVATEAQNENVLKLILSDMEENYIEGNRIGENGKFYVRIENDSPNAKLKEIYRILPESMKQAIKESPNGYIAVRQDMLLNYFGFRDMSILDIPGVSLFTPKIMVRAIKTAEMIWQEIVKVSKVDIVLRMPSVLLGNIVSNIMYSIVNGTSPIRVAKMSIENARNITEYVNKKHEIEKLKIEMIKGNNTARKIAKLEGDLKTNPVHDLMKAGMYQTLVEELGTKEFKSSNRVSRFISKKTEGMPEIIKQGAHWLYLDESTQYFKFMATATQYSDFVARATEYQLLQERGIEKKEAMEHVLDAFVNYNKPATAFEEYLNSMGFIMFTKYFKRIQRAVAKGIKDKPLNVLIAILGQEALFEVDDIYDQNVLTRSYGNIGINPIDHVQRAFTPTLLEPLL